MAANLKAGIMATTTMVGSALAYSKSQTREQGQRTSSIMAGLASSTGGPPPGQQQRQQGGQTETHLGGNNNYQETVNQMMHWKY